MIKTAKKLILGSWRFPASALAVLLIAAQTALWGTAPSAVVAHLLRTAGLNDEWPAAAHVWANDPMRHQIILRTLGVVGAVLLMTHAAHAWSRGDNTELFRRIKGTPEHRQNLIREQVDYDRGRLSQTFSAMWIVLALAAEVVTLSVTVWVGFAVALGAGSLLMLRHSHAREWVSLVPIAVLGDLAMFLLVVLYLPLRILGILTEPRLKQRASEPA